MLKAIYIFSPVMIFTILFGCIEQKKANKVSAAVKMQEFIISISNYARSYDPDFIIIPQNGAEIAFKKTNPDDAISINYLKAIDAFAVEELFYNGALSPDNYRINMLKKLGTEKTIMVSEYIKDDSNIADAVKKNADEGFICFPRSERNYHYHTIPEKIQNENSDDITKLSQIKNYLYLISTAEFDDKEHFIEAISKTNYDMVTIDLFFEKNEPFTKEEIARLKTKANGGKRLVIGYMNIGAAENWRYYWRKNWKLYNPDFIRKSYEDYEDEFWVKFWDKDWQKIIYDNDDSYTKKIIDAGFDGAFLDNVEAYYFLYKDK